MSSVRCRVSWRRALVVTCLSLLGSLPCMPQAFSQDYSIEDLGPLTGPFDYLIPEAINNQGQVVGRGTTTDHQWRGFLWADGKLQVLGTLGGQSSIAMDINEQGQIAGWATTAASDFLAHGVMWTKETILDLGSLPGGDGGNAYGINDLGQIVGGAGNPYRAFIWANGSLQDLGVPPFSVALGINSTGQVVGEMSMADGPHAFLWTQGRIQDLGSIGAPWRDLCINEAGQVAGSVGVKVGELYRSRAVRWTGGVKQDLGSLPGGNWSSVGGINAAGDVVGEATIADGNYHAFLYTDAMGMIDLNTRIDLTLGWQLTSAAGINDRGQIVGRGIRDYQWHALCLTPRTGKLLVDPTRLVYGQVILGTKQSQGLVLTNPSTQTVSVTVGTLQEPFSVVEGGGNFSLAPGANKKIVVEFAPTRLGPFQATLSITRSDLGAAAVDVPITGEGIGF
jgi:probable HAF family extracellular repeat protein